MSASPRPEPFQIAVSDAALDDLKRRLAATRWPEPIGPDDWSAGTPISEVQALAEYWRDGFDWRVHERRLNELPQFRVTIDDYDIHFVHVRGRGPNPLPLLLTNGWPSSIYEYVKVIGPLTDPAAHGGDEADAFDVVIPALPGYPFSRAPNRVDTWPEVPGLWRNLMTDVLGYPRFVASGGDLGAILTTALGALHGDVVAAIQLEAVFGATSLEDPTLTPAERAFLEQRAAWARDEGAYAHQQGTRPRTLSFGLSDSPAGMLAWIMEKYRAWSDCGGDLYQSFTRDELLVTPTLYWAANSIGASFRPYADTGEIVSGSTFAYVEVPVGVALYPGDLPRPERAYAERHFNVQRWTQMPRGGHFAPLEVPELWVAETRAFFARTR
jgi:pimeloyl-ACP methyl ester carboxylesterase